MGDRIKALRKVAGLTQEELSKLSGVPRVVIAKSETGATNPSLKTLMKLSKALDCSVDDLIQEPIGR